MVGRRKEHRSTPADLLVVGLGNPGEDYAQTRHNAGVWVIEELVRRHGGRLTRGKRDHAETDELRIGSRRLAVAVPSTFMNESGRAVAPLVRRYGIDDLSRLVIVHESWTTGGFGAEVAAVVASKALMDLDAPIERVGALDVPMPYNDNLERATIPTQERIEEAVRKVAEF